MRHRAPTHIALALVAAGLGATTLVPAAGAAAPTAATPSPASTTPAVPPVQIGPDVALTALEQPADLRYYSDLGLFRRTPVLSPDGSLQWLFSRQRSNDDARALGTASASLTQRATTPVVFGTLAGSTALRSTGVFGGDGTSVDRQLPGMTAVDGGTWFIDNPQTPRPARSRLVQFNDRGQVTAHITAPKGINLVDAVQTAKGLRLVGIESKKSKKSSFKNYVVVIDGRHVTHQRYIQNLTGAAALPDGSLLLAGGSTSNLPTPVLRVTPAGHVSRLADRRAPGAATVTAGFGLVATRAGIVTDEASGTYNATPLKDALVLRDGAGKVARRVLIKDLKFPKPAGCLADQETPDAQFGNQAPPALMTLGVGPDGLPMARIRCTEISTYQQPDYFGAITRTVTNPRDTQITLVGLNADLTVRWWRNAKPELLTAPDDYPYYQRAQACGSDTTGADGRLDILDCNGRVTAVAVPGASVVRGTLTSTARDGKTGAVARITCKGEIGQMCSGVASVSANGVVVGSAPYTLPARPGKAASQLDRHIQTTTALPKSYAVALGAPAAS